MDSSVTVGMRKFLWLLELAVPGLSSDYMEMIGYEEALQNEPDGEQEALLENCEPHTQKECPQ